MKRLRAILAAFVCAKALGPGGMDAPSCPDEDCEEAGLLQGLSRRDRRFSSHELHVDGKGWTLLEPNPDLLEWKFKGYYWKGDASTLPDGAAHEGLCIWLYKPDLDAGLRRAACTKRQKTYFVSKYSLAEEDFHTTLVGYLKVPLEYDEMKPSSNVTLSLRISAFLGPAGADAPLILRHCGGPSSSDVCAMTNGEDPVLGQAFTWFGIQQRGMSTYSSAPSGHYPSPERPVDIIGKTFDGVCEGAHTLTPPKDADKEYTLKDFTTCVCDLPEDPYMPYPSPFPDPADEEKVRSWFAFSESRDQACYKADYWKISSGAHHYNFLDFVGTQLLAMDMDRFREAVGHKKLHIQGYSYGTAVGSSYLAAFPGHAGNVVLNGNVHPGPGVDDYYESVAIAARQGMTKLVTICNRQMSFLPEQTIKKCQVPSTDPVAFFFDVIAMIKGNVTASSPSVYSRETWSGNAFTLTPEMVYHYLARLASARAENQQMWVDSLITIVQLGSHNLTEIKDGTLTIFDQACSKAWYDYNYCWPVMLNTIGTNDNCITSRAVRAADYVSRYTVAGAMDTYRRLNRNYKPIEVYFANAKAGFGLQTWPADPAPGMYGFRAGVSPVIINSLYDMSTPYSNAKLMRQGFPNGVLMTWQGIGHCVGDADYDPEGVKSCMARVTKYLLTGELPPDGFVCHQTQYIKAAPAE